MNLKQNDYCYNRYHGYYFIVVNVKTINDTKGLYHGNLEEYEIVILPDKNNDAEIKKISSADEHIIVIENLKTNKYRIVLD